MTYNHIQAFMTKGRLEELLERNEMSRDELAKLMGASERTIEAIDKGEYDPPLSVAYKLAAALRMPVERLFTD